MRVRPPKRRSLIWARAVKDQRWIICPLCLAPVIRSKYRAHVRYDLGGHRWCLNPACTQAFPCIMHACPYYLPTPKRVGFPTREVWAFFSALERRRLAKVMVPPRPPWPTDPAPFLAQQFEQGELELFERARLAVVQTLAPRIEE